MGAWGWRGAGGVVGVTRCEWIISMQIDINCFKKSRKYICFRSILDFLLDIFLEMSSSLRKMICLH